MTYSESAQGIVISHDRAMQELKRHGLWHDSEVEAFYLEMGRKPEYQASDVLEWLGY